MATLLWQRDISTDVSSVKTTFSSWDQCMSKAYCKWPVIVAIIIGALICLSLLFCIARIICFGAECCFCCASCARCCCSSCCSSKGRSRSKGYEQTPPAQPYAPYNQYQSAAPMYASPMPSRPAYAQFDAPTRGAGVHDDSLPAMPSWDTTASRRIDNPTEENLEMEQLDQGAPMLPKPAVDTRGYQYHSGPAIMSGGLGVASPYHMQPQSPVGQQQQSYYPQAQEQGYGGYAGYGHPSNAYAPQQSQAQGYMQQGYEPSIPPSYHTSAPTVARRPVQGSWRDS